MLPPEDFPLSATRPEQSLGLLDLLDLADTGPDRFSALTPAEGPPRLFGGQVASQSLRAASLTVPADRQVHSLHSYFVRPGRPGVPLEMVVERTRDGRSFSTRRVSAVQEDEAIFVLDASFHLAEEGIDWHEPGPAGVPPPEQVEPRSPFAGLMGRGLPPGVDPSKLTPEAAAALVAQLAEAEASRPAARRGGPPMSSQFEMRPLRLGEDFSIHPSWVRFSEEIPDDPALHACALTYISDMAVVRSARAPGAGPGWGGASLDHAVWFHRPIRVDQWHLFSVEPVSNFGARGLARGTFHTVDGVLVASFMQECLLRSTGMPPPP